MVRAEVVDASGRLVADASHEVTFEVVSGGGAGLGDALRATPPTSTRTARRAAAPPRARAVHRALDGRRPATPPWHRASLREIDLDGGRRTTVADPATDGARAPPPPIVVRASAAGLAAVTLAIPVTRRRRSARCGRSRARRIKIGFTLHERFPVVTLRCETHLCWPRSLRLFGDKKFSGFAALMRIENAHVRVNPGALTGGARASQARPCTLENLKNRRNVDPYPMGASRALRAPAPSPHADPPASQIVQA